MKKILTFATSLIISAAAFSQKPSKEQMKKDKEAFAKAQKQLNETLSKMSPEARKQYDSMMNAFGAGQAMQNASSQVNTNTPKGTAGMAVSKGSVPGKNTLKINAIAATPSIAGMGSFIKNVNSKALSALTPIAKQEGKNIYEALKAAKVNTTQIGQTANLFWIMGQTQTALYIMAQACADDPGNTDNLNNYASMLHTLDAPQLAIPILINLNARFKNNSTILNNLGQAWFALGEVDKADKYLDTAIRIAAYHPQANFTKCLIAESKGNKTAAIAYARAAMKGGYSKAKEEKLKQLGYTPTADDMSDIPGYKNKPKDMLNLAGFQPPPFPRNIQESEALEPVWKSYKAEIENRIRPLEKQAQEYNKQLVKSTEDRIKRGMEMMDRAKANPGSVSQAEAMALSDAPVFAAKIMYKQKPVLENIVRKRNALIQKLQQFYKGEGAALENKYKKEIEPINKKYNESAGEGQSGALTAELCRQRVKLTNEFLAAYNVKLEELFHEYLGIEKQYFNEMAYTNLYTTYPEAINVLNAGLKSNWLRDLQAISFNFKSIKMIDCADPIDAPGKGKLQEFVDPRCNINSEFSQSLGVYNLGFSIKITCNEMSTSFNALALGLTVKQDMTHADFIQSIKGYTATIGAKGGTKAEMGPLEVSAKAGAVVDIELDKNFNVEDVTVKAGAEAEATFSDKDFGTDHGVGASAGMEGKISLNSGQGSISGTGILGQLK